MKLLTKKLEDRFKEVGSQDGKGDEAIVIAKFFNPTGAGTWLATEYEPINRIFFGYVSIFGESGMDEWGYFSLDELQEFRGRFGLGIERDLNCSEKPASEWITKLTTK